MLWLALESLRLTATSLGQARQQPIRFVLVLVCRECWWCSLCQTWRDFMEDKNVNSRWGRGRSANWGNLRVSRWEKGGKTLERELERELEIRRRIRKRITRRWRHVSGSISASSTGQSCDASAHSVPSRIASQLLLQKPRDRTLSKTQRGVECPSLKLQTAAAEMGSACCCCCCSSCQDCCDEISNSSG